MHLLDHVSITVRDLDAARPFYEAVMAALGVPKVNDRPDAIGFGQRNRPCDDAHTYLSVYRSAAAAPDPRRHWCFRAASEAQVRAFFQAGIDAGGSSEGAPGLRPNYHAGYFAAFLADPDGNRIEAVYHNAGSAGDRTQST
jgi:catechol 2,3-dioxygenase-like lactoylglutathione lyase family enzyme